MFRLILIAVCFSGFVIQGYGQCPEKNGRFPLSGQCDGYIECTDGVPEEKLCPDGLLFNDKLSPMAYPCQYPIDVSCENRGRTQTAQPTEDCPHQFGYYRLGDKADCGRFMNCAAGRSYIFECPEGLAFNKDQYRCDWPDQVDDCDEEAYLKFKCPQIAKSSELGFEEQRTFKSPHDCQHYYVCLEGKPRLLSCGEDRAFNDATNSCDELENVPGCVTNADSLCPQSNGKFGVPGQCDAYIECTDGIHEEKLCPDGLLFNDELSPDGECQYKPSVSCENRAKLQPPQPTDVCPHQFGFYRIGDASHCQTYMNCAHGVGSLTKCPEGLAFNEKTYKCDWPDETDDCDSEAYLDFKCPPPLVRAVNEDGNEIEPAKLRHYRNEKSCKHYFVCVNEKPRLYACAKFLLYNDQKKGCDFRSDITECNKDRPRPNLSQVTELQKIDPIVIKTFSKRIDFDCPEDDDGTYPDPEQCDAFIECKDGIAFRELCPDGLVFNHRVRHADQKCQFKPMVECGNRTKLQPAKPTKRCRHQNGMFRIGDSAHCAKFYNCAHGVGTLSKCAIGLAFNEENYRCDYPELVAACNVTAYLGFKCPEPDANLDDYDESVMEVPKYYRHEKNWNHYFICDVEGNARKYACTKDHIYNVETKACEPEEFEYYDDDEVDGNVTISTTTKATKSVTDE